MLNELQKQTARAIINIFETGHIVGDYGQVTLLANDSGHLTYGRSQTTLASGNLYLLIKAYCEQPGTQYGQILSDYLPALKVRDFALDHNTSFKNWLKKAGLDPIMHDVQDDFFDRIYWQPAINSATALGVGSALGITVVYDSHIHGAWPRMRDRTIDHYGKPVASSEKEWVRHYINTRRDWLANHPNRLLRRTVYRMDSFLRLLQQGQWQLALPLTVRGLHITEGNL
jgi:chitosanase